MAQEVFNRYEKKYLMTQEVYDLLLEGLDLDDLEDIMEDWTDDPDDSDSDDAPDDLDDADEDDDFEEDDDEDEDDEPSDQQDGTVESQIKKFSRRGGTVNPNI